MAGPYAKISEPVFTGKITGIDIVLAQLIVKAAGIREASYDHEASNKAFFDSKAKAGLDMRYRFVDSNTFYTISLFDAAAEACSDYANLQTPVYLLLDTTWNGSLEWADLVLGVKTSITD